ncbi:CehA/McbA family metallohydrolase [Hymenobacter sp. YC55]|uniref:CehA/McbA family metallohydrolase n=1 Tax=Hymenobacter sp. YC55 TaxID=3034019 RepID=UPI0023F93B39|nr:CehA/McbA family metallohydrolase [Hymenobacter sp. YC55]MDF7815055.1 CehA/McbA family metallohydrolase [Hymenobacter sp. YC55]
MSNNEQLVHQKRLQRVGTQYNWALLLAILVSVVCLAGPAAAQAPPTTVVRQGHVPADSLFKLFYVPIEVPAGTTEIRVQEDYNRQGGNVLNMGVYDPAGYRPGTTAGFRGWSGGAKTAFFINAQSASTGYVPGSVQPGTWHVLLYPSTIAPSGLDWKLTVTLVSGPAGSAFVAAPAVAAVNNQPGWYQGDLHMHTLHSDGRRTPAELVDEASAQGLDFLVSTEHNTNSANLSWGRYARPNLLVVNGEEVTTTAFGHWNALGLAPTTLIDWRYAPQDSAIATYTAQVRALGGLAIINHPFFPDTVNRFQFGVRHFDGIEVWNGSWDARNEQALRWWDELLRQGRSLLAVGASDTHTAAPSPNQLGRPRTVVQARSLSRAGIMQGLRARRAYLVADRYLNLMFTAQAGRAQASIGDTLTMGAGQRIKVAFKLRGASVGTVRLLGANGVLATSPVAASGSTTVQWQLPPGLPRYLRVEVRTPQGAMLALTNPIWVSSQ